MIQSTPEVDTIQDIPRLSKWPFKWKHEGLMKGLIKNVLAKRDKTNSEGKKQWPQKFDEPVRVWKTIKKRKAEMKDMKYSMFEMGQTMSRKGT